jgi:hypothetical protein
MAPYRNKGWSHYEKFQDIMPNATARGRNSFSAMHMAPPIPLNDTLDDPTIVDESTNDSIAAGSGNTLINPMDVDQHRSDTTSVFTSNSFGKRKLDAIASDEELVISDSKSGKPIPPSPSIRSLSTGTSASEMPAKKKTSRSLPRSSSTHSSQQRVQSTSAKMTPTLIAHEIQGSINSLASALRESGLTDPVAKLRQDAIHHVSDDDGLSGMDKLAIIDLFRKDYAAVQTYIALLRHNDLRQAWLEKQLQELNH